ncbi:hypothetical protein GH733_005533, partial [Mirounga leonina]
MKDEEINITIIRPQNLRPESDVRHHLFQSPQLMEEERLCRIIRRAEGQVPRYGGCWGSGHHTKVLEPPEVQIDSNELAEQLGAGSENLQFADKTAMLERLKAGQDCTTPLALYCDDGDAKFVLDSAGLEGGHEE